MIICMNNFVMKNINSLFKKKYVQHNFKETSWLTCDIIINQTLEDNYG